MTSVQITSQINIGLDQLLNGVAQLETAELQQFFEQVHFLLVQRKVNKFPQRETELLGQINQGLPEAIQRRYDELQVKLHDEVITAEEHEELMALLNPVEQASVDRLQALVELSQLRQVSVNDLMIQLEIHHPPMYD